MFRNYLAAALRNLLRDRAYAAINILGLAIGFTATLLIALYVRAEYSFDRHFPEPDRTYRLYVEYVPPGRAPIRISVASARVARALELDFPDVETATRLVLGTGTLRQGNIEVIGNIGWADPNFARLFPLETLAGGLDSALKNPDGLVLSRSMARRLFNREDVLGESISLNRQQTVRVAAILEDLPANTHFAFDVVAPGIASFSELTRYDQLVGRTDVIQPENVYTYMRLRPGASVEKLNAAMDGFVRRHFRPGDRNGVPLSRDLRYTWVALPDLHFLPPSIADMKAPGDRRALHGLMTIAALILFVAASNFVSMMTARSARRAIEVGVRKAVGATRRQLVVQFLGECLFYSGLALGVALIATSLALPALNGFVQRNIELELFTDPLLLAGLMASWLVVGLAAGAYPALVLSMFRPVTVLKGAISLPGGPGRLRQAMVVLQFGTLIALIVATITVHRQTRFAIEDQLRIPTDETFLLNFACSQRFTAVRETMAALPGVRAASCTSGSSLLRDRFGTRLLDPTGAGVDFRASAIDPHYFDIFAVTPLAGRLLDETHGEDTLVRRERGTVLNPSIVINEAGARALGFTNPADAVDQYRRWPRPTSTGPGSFRVLEPQVSRIVGVVPDLIVGSVRDPIEPTVYYVDPSMAFFLLLKLEGQSIPETMPRIEAAWKMLSEGLPFRGQFLSQVLDDLYLDIRRQTSLFSAFAAVAIVVAALGLLGLAVFTAERRTREIGLRKAMGASRADVLRFIGWQFARPVLIANLIAWPAAWFLMRRWLNGFAYHVDLGPLAFVLASTLALVIALLTVTGHALLVARARPVEALRYE